MNHSTFVSALGLGCAVVVLCAVVTLWRRSLRAIVRALAVQGIALASMALTLGVHGHDSGLESWSRCSSSSPKAWSSRR